MSDAPLRELKIALVLHTRPFQERHQWVDCFVKDHGRLSFIAKNCRSKRAKWRGFLRPFIPIFISWRGRSDLGTLSQVEPTGEIFMLKDRVLWCGLYLNELLIRVLHRADPYPELFIAYKNALCALDKGDNESTVLRMFEKKLLCYLGFALVLDHNIHTKEKVDAEKYYSFNFQEGISIIKSPQFVKDKQRLFKGQSLLDMHHEEFSNVESLHDAKRLLQYALAQLMPYHSLKTREYLFSQE